MSSETGEAEVVCERLVWGWGRERIGADGPGYGVLARSAGWPWTEDDGGLDTDVGYLDNRVTLAEGPRVLVVRRTEDGCLAIVKRSYGADAHDRPTHRVHAMLDRSGRLTAVDAVAGLLQDDRFGTLRDLPAWEENLPRLALPLNAPRPGVPVPGVVADLTPFWNLLLAAVLLRLDDATDRPVVVEVDSAQLAEDLVLTLLRILPAGLAARLDVGTFAQYPGEANLHLCCAIRGLSALPDDPAVYLIDADGNSTVPRPPDPIADAARAIVGGAQGRGDRPGDTIATIPALARWAISQRLALAPPEELGTAEVADLLAGDSAASWLRRPGAVRAAVRAAVVEAPEGAACARSLTALLSRDARLAADVAEPTLREVVARAGARTSPAVWAVLERLAAAAAPTRGPHALGIAVLAEATDALRSGATVDGWAVDLALRHGGSLTAADRETWLRLPTVSARLTDRWNDLLAVVVAEAVRGERPQDGPGIVAGALAAGHHEPLGAVLADVADRADLDPDTLVATGAAAPVEELGWLVPRLVDLGFPAQDLLMRMLGDERLRDEPARSGVLLPLLRRHWVTLALGAGLPEAVVVLLEPGGGEERAGTTGPGGAREPEPGDGAGRRAFRAWWR